MCVTNVQKYIMKSPAGYKSLHKSDDTNDIQSQSPGGVMQKKADKICKSHKKAPVLEPLPNKVQDVNL